ncbi:MAG: hypothetical protein ABSB74_19435 [Tepidisphaeraceae bacterium]
MFELMKQLRGKEARDGMKLIARYREILEAADGATPAQVEELSGLMQKLGYDSAQVEKDARALANRAFLVKLSGEMPARQLRHSEAAKARADFDEKMRKTIAAMTAKSDELSREANRAETAFHESRRSADRLAALAKEHWELFGLPAEPIEEPQQQHIPRPIDFAKAAAEYWEPLNGPRGVGRERENEPAQDDAPADDGSGDSRRLERPINLPDAIKKAGAEAEVGPD